MITDEHIKEYIENGVVVIEGILSDEEVERARNNFH
jgi:hypothetical protein